MRMPKRSGRVFGDVMDYPVEAGRTTVLRVITPTPQRSSCGESVRLCIRPEHGVIVAEDRGV